MWDLSSPSQGSSLHPLQLECRVFTSGLLGKSWGSCENADSGSGVLRWGLGFCSSNSLPDDAGLKFTCEYRGQKWSSYFSEHKNDLISLLKKWIPRVTTECWGWSPGVCIFNTFSGKLVVQKPLMENVISLPTIFSEHVSFEHILE